MDERAQKLSKKSLTKVKRGEKMDKKGGARGLIRRSEMTRRKG